MIGQVSNIAARRCKALAQGLCLIGLGALLAACTSPEDLPVSDRAEGCPETAIVSGAESVTLFSPGGGPDLSDMVMRGTLVEFSGECAYEDNLVTIDVALIVAGERGPAIGADGTVAVEYFVAVLDAQQRIIGKEVFEAGFTFDERRTRALSREELRQVIPLENARIGSAYSVLMGFQLTEDQRLYNLGQ